jgi:hypothetical protein
MRRRITVLVLVLVVVLLGGLLAAGVSRMRDEAARTQCVNNLRQIALGLHNYYGTYQRHLPPATVPHAELTPERRLSWLVPTVPYFEQTHLIIDLQKGWDAEENQVPKVRYLDKEDEPLNEVRLFRCPSNPASATPGTPGLTHYVGCTGVGLDAATLGLGYPGTGVFGNDRQICFEDIKDGLATTLLVLEATKENGPWTAGGFPTARGLDQAGVHYVGPGRQFGSNHRGTNVALADGSVRSLTDDIGSDLFEAMATIAGGEEVGILGSQ